MESVERIDQLRETIARTQNCNDIDDQLTLLTALNELWGLFSVSNYTIEAHLDILENGFDPYLNIFNRSLSKVEEITEFIYKQDVIRLNALKAIASELTPKQLGGALFKIVPEDNKELINTDTINADFFVFCLSYIAEQNYKLLLAQIKACRLASTHILDIYSKIDTVIAKKNRAKRKPKEDPNIETARQRAKEIWAKRSRTSLLDTAYQIKEELNIRKSVGTVQEWIRDLNPNAKKKKISK